MPNNTTPAAILCPLSGAYLMEASAGTGKTWTLTGILLRLLVEKSTAPESIVATTFTRAAAQEIYERLNARLLDFATLMDWLAANSELFAISSPDEKTQLLSSAPDVLADPLLGYLFEWVVAGGQERLTQTQRRLGVAQLNLDKMFVGTLDALAQKWLGEFFDHQEEQEILSDTHAYTHALTHDVFRQIRASLYYDYPTLFALFDEKSLGDLNKLSDKLSAVFEFGDVPVCHAPSLEGLAKEAIELHQSIQKMAMADFSEFEPYFDMDYRINQGMNKTYTLTKYFHHLPALLSDLSLGIDGFFGLDNDQKKLIESFGKESIGRFNKNHEPQQEAWHALDLGRLAQLFVLYERCLALKDSIKSAVIARLIVQVRQKLPKLLADDKKTSFFLKMQSLLDKLNTPSGKQIAQHIRHLYPVALIDEAQDLNNAQATLLAKVYLSHNPPPKQFLLVVGDPKQAIYRFRGGDVANYLYLKGLGLDTSFRLNVNQRTHLGLVNAMNAWFGEGYDALGDGIFYEPVGAKRQEPKYPFDKPLTFLHLKDKQADKFELVVRHVCELLAKGVPACDVAVLVAKNEDIHRLQRLFGQCNVPTKSSQSPSIFVSRACQELAGVFLAVLKPEPIRLLSALTGFFGYAFDKAQAILVDDHQKSTFLLYLSGVYEAWQKRGASFAFVKLMERHPFEKISVWESQACFAGAQGYLSDLWQLFDVLAGFDGTILAFVEHLKTQRKDKDHLTVRTDEMGVTISTMHKSKGLEFSVVYVLDLYKIKQPNTQVYFYHENHERKLSVVPKKGEQDFAKKDQQEALDEKKRLGYVALTRAADKLYVVLQDLAKKSDNAMARWGFLPDGEHFVLPARLSDHADWVDADALLEQAFSDLPAQTPPALVPSDWQSLYPKRVFDGVYRTSFSALTYRLKKPNPQTISFEEPNPQQVLSVADYDDSDLATESLPDSQDIRTSWRRGVVGGSFLHAALQKMPQRPPRLAVQDAVYEQNLIVDNDSQDAIATWLGQVLDEPFAASKAIYWQLGVRQHEFDFVLGDFANVHMANLIQLFNAHSPWELEPLTDQRNYGYLCGSIDLVYEHLGRFYVVDFKSNYLSDYTQEAMKHAMNQHHYWLQAALYQLALHRFLKVRLPDYLGNESQYLGATEFVFLRGAGLGLVQGRLVWEVPLSLVLALDNFLGGVA